MVNLMGIHMAGDTIYTPELNPTDDAAGNNGRDHQIRVSLAVQEGAEAVVVLSLEVPARMSVEDSVPVADSKASVQPSDDSYVTKLLKRIAFDERVKEFQQLLSELPQNSTAHRDLSCFLNGIGEAKATWMKNPTQHGAFIRTCFCKAEEAQHSSLKNYEKVSVLLQALICAVNWLASWFMKEPLIKTQTYRYLKFFKEGVCGMVVEQNPSDDDDLSSQPA